MDTTSDIPNINKECSYDGRHDNDACNKYIEHMDPKEQLAYEIAKKHLGSSFSLVKSIGFKKFMKTN